MNQCSTSSTTFLQLKTLEGRRSSPQIVANMMDVLMTFISPEVLALSKHECVVHVIFSELDERRVCTCEQNGQCL